MLLQEPAYTVAVVFLNELHVTKLPNETLNLREYFWFLILIVILRFNNCFLDKLFLAWACGKSNLRVYLYLILVTIIIFYFHAIQGAWNWFFQCRKIWRTFQLTDTLV